MEDAYALPTSPWPFITPNHASNYLHTTASFSVSFQNTKATQFLQAAQFQIATEFAQEEV